MAECVAGQLKRSDAVLSYQAWGDGPALVLVHGLAGYGREWRPLANRLGSAFRFVVFDQRGHGGSTRQPVDLSRRAFVDDLLAVVDAVSPHDPAILVGQSMGAHTAMLAAAADPSRVTRLVMIEGGVGGGDPAAARAIGERLAAWPIPFPDRASAVAFFGEGDAAEAWADGLELRDGQLWPCFDPAVMTTSIAPVLIEPAWKAWDSLAVPTLLVLGDDGTIDPDQVRQMLERQPLARQTVIGGAGHDVHLDRPDGLAKAILDRHPGTSMEVKPGFTSKPSDPDHHMAGIIARHVVDLGYPPPISIPSLGGSDCRFWRKRGIPAFVYGTSPSNISAPDESTSVEEFLHVVRVHTLAAIDYLTG